MKWDKLQEYIEETIKYAELIKQSSDVERGFMYGLDDVLNKMRNLAAEEETNSLNKYWIPEELNEHVKPYVTIGKEYKIIWDSSDKEEVIIDDEGSMSLDFILHKGRYITKGEEC